MQTIKLQDTYALDIPPTATVEFDHIISKWAMNNNLRLNSLNTR